jgi:hypothetical protein
VTSDNAEQYIQEVLDAIIGTGARPQAKAFREGFSKVFPISDLQAFSADELVMLFGNSDEDWSIESAFCTVSTGAVLTCYILQLSTKPSRLTTGSTGKVAQFAT